MDGKFKLFLGKNKKKTELKIELNFSKNDFLLAILAPNIVNLFSNENFLKLFVKFLEFVVEIVKFIMNRPIYYFENDRFFFEVRGLM